MVLDIGDLLVGFEDIDFVVVFGIVDLLVVVVLDYMDMLG